MLGHRSTPPISARRRVLVAGPNADRIRRAMVAQGHDVRTAPTGEQALQLAEFCDLVILDVGTPYADGGAAALCRALATSPPRRHASVWVKGPRTPALLDCPATAYLIESDPGAPWSVPAQH